MDKGHDERSIERIEDSGVTLKSAQVSSQKIDSKELSQINKLTLEPLKEEDIFVFKVAMCDNEIDRDFEVFPLKTLQGLQKLFIGKTIIKDHKRTSDNQVARIYSTELVQHGNKTTKTGELFTQLVGKCYMLNNDSNKNLIDEIKAGIKKEVSIGCSLKKEVCSICGTDNRKTWCNHMWGKNYEGKECYFTLEEPKDAYELSFVAVPAQSKAGIIKKYESKQKCLETINNKEKNTNKESTLDLDIELIDSFLFINKNFGGLEDE